MILLVHVWNVEYDGQIIETCWIQHSDHKSKIVSSLLWMFAEMGDQLQKETAGLNVFINLLNSCKNHSVLLKGLIKLMFQPHSFSFCSDCFHFRSPHVTGLFDLSFSVWEEIWLNLLPLKDSELHLHKKIGLNSDSSVNRGSRHASSNYIEYYDHMHLKRFLMPKSRKKC